jgi:hypothetical protein
MLSTTGKMSWFPQSISVIALSGVYVTNINPLMLMMHETKELEIY